MQLIFVHYYKILNTNSNIFWLNYIFTVERESGQFNKGTKFILDKALKYYDKFK